MSEADPLAGWRLGLADGRLRFPCCRRCGRWNWYPLPRCRGCAGDELAWIEVPPDGRIHSWTRVHRAFGGPPAAPLPYVVGIVDIDAAPGVRLVCLQHRPGPAPAIGAAVRLALARGADEARWTFAAVP